jgi:hypothetical protein
MLTTSNGSIYYNLKFAATGEWWISRIRKSLKRLEKIKRQWIKEERQK